MIVFKMCLALIVVGIVMASIGNISNFPEMVDLGIAISILFFVVAGIAGFIEQPIKVEKDESR